jgi:hypothetical protein
MSQKINLDAKALIVSPSQIQYTFITPNTSYSPSDFYILSFDLLRTFPIDLLQLQDSFSFYNFSAAMCLRKGVNLYMMPDFVFVGNDNDNKSLFEGYSGEFNNDLVKVFLIDKDIQNHKEIAALISEISFAYFVIIGDPGIESAVFYNQAKAFSTAEELIKLIEKDLPAIDQIIYAKYNIKIGSFKLQDRTIADKLNPRYKTLYANSNYFLLNQIVSNYWQKDPEEIKKEDVEMFSKERTSIQIQQITRIDRFAQEGRNNAPITPIEPDLAPLVIIAPFHFPKYGKLLKNEFKQKKEKMLFRASQTEQCLEYTYEIDNSVASYLKLEQIGMILKMLSEKLLMLDYVGYLHAQLSYSPIIRLPIVGKSLNMDLSHFQQSFTNKKNAVKKISIVGELMRKKMVADELAAYLKDRDGQMVFISDLPMEWLKLGEYPICLTHDVCRIPEFNFNSLLNNYVHNQRLTFRIKSDILRKTLIIHCAGEDDQDMHLIFKMFEDLQHSLGFVSVFCSSVEEISGAINEHHPDLLVFDCHGNFDQDNLSSYLVIDDKNNILLTGEDIIANKISAPLVFISACSTMPNYGYVKFLSDAFFQAGAFSVTATFLPIKMGEAAALIIKLLTNLKQQETKTVFSNWLAFISHTLRTTMIYETIRKAKISNNFPENVDDNKISEILLQLMVFATRKDAFENLKNYLQNINPDVNPEFESLDHEWLSYTTIGRADLIYFENWILEHQKQNAGTTEKETATIRKEL